MAEKKDLTYQGCYGSKMKPSEIKNWILDCVEDNSNREKNKITCNIWGPPGCGKTSIIKSLEDVGYKIVDIPLAQIEEMGDILGFPVEEIEMANEKGTVWIKAVDSLISSYLKEGYVNTGGQRTVYAPPAWVPRVEEKGVILFDDGNRASQRIMKGLMQLVQDYRTISWKIPKGWTIIFTGNPDNRFNQVTSMDTAQLTRMKHITLTPDAVEWASWATDNGIDSRLINFILRYPEMMIGKERTNPRTLAEFGRTLKKYPVLDKSNHQRVSVEAYASLDDETVQTMMVFFERNAELVIEPIVILEDPDKAKTEIERLMTKQEPRIDIVNVINDRLFAFITSSVYEHKKEHIKPFQDWLTNKYLPKDAAYSFVRRLVFSDCPYRRQLLSGNTELLEIVKITWGKGQPW
jgi:MoxR-like ATPase